jgi:ribosomal RNA assembly protein
MIAIYCDKLPRILKTKKYLEEKLNVKITNQGREVFVEGTPEEEYTAGKIIEALNYGFEFKDAMLIKEEDFITEIISIKDYTKRSDLSRVRARIIGKEGRTKSTLTQLTKCFFQVKGNDVAIIGYPENMKNAQEAIISLIRGSKQANVYKFLEKHQIQPVLDFGLKDNKDNL